MLYPSYDNIKTANSSRVPTGLEDVSTFPALFAELLTRGWSEGDLAKLAGGNLLRVMRATEQVSTDILVYTYKSNGI